MRHQGKLSNWNDARGFGFISVHSGGEPVFVHISAFTPGSRRPVGNEIVTYELLADGRGRRRAGHVTFASGRQTDRGASAISFSAGLTGIFFLLLGVSIWAGKVPLAVLAWYAGASVIAFVAYWNDKSAARHQRWRTQESTLQLLGLIGGWPGALLAQRTLRHKCNKQPFQFIFRAMATLNCVALLLYATPAGARLLGAFLRSLA